MAVRILGKEFRRAAGALQDVHFHQLERNAEPGQRQADLVAVAGTLIRIERVHLDSISFAHDLIRKPVPTFRDHALEGPGAIAPPIWGAKAGHYKATMRGYNASPHLWRTAANATRQTLRTKKLFRRHPVRAGV